MKTHHISTLILAGLLTCFFAYSHGLHTWGISGYPQNLTVLCPFGNSIYAVGKTYSYPGAGHVFSEFLKFNNDLIVEDSVSSTSDFTQNRVHFNSIAPSSSGVFVCGATDLDIMIGRFSNNGFLEYYLTDIESGSLNSIIPLTTGGAVATGGAGSSPYGVLANFLILGVDDTCGLKFRLTPGLGHYIKPFKLNNRFLILSEVAYDTVGYPNHHTRLVLEKYNHLGQLIDSIHFFPGYAHGHPTHYFGYIRNAVFQEETQTLFIGLGDRIFVFDTTLNQVNTILLSDVGNLKPGTKFFHVDPYQNLTILGTADLMSTIGQTQLAVFRYGSGGNLIYAKPVFDFKVDYVADVVSWGSKILISGTRSGNYMLLELDTLGNLCHSPCVWPGDVNHDGVVNHSDALYLALAQGDSGTIRYNATLQWRQQDSRDWTASFANGVNIKHADTDGDGHITLSDTLAIGQNYMQTHQKSAAGSSSGIPVWLSLDATGPAVNLHVGESQNLPLYGIAYTISLSGPATFSGQQAMHQSGWLTTGAGQALALHKFFDNHQTLEAALARTNRADATGSGHIATIPLNLLPGSGPVMATLEFVQLVTADGAFHPAALRGDTALLSSLPEVAGEKARLDVFPIPAGDELRLSLTGSGEQLKTINLFSLDGRLLLSQQIETPQTNIVLALPPAATGTLLLEATTTTGTIYRKKVVRLR